MLSTKDIDDLELSFQNINSINMLKTILLTFIFIYIIYNIFSY